MTLGGRAPRYRCKDHGHLTRNAGHVDDLVFAHVVYALTHPRAYELLAEPAPEVDAPALHAERKAIRNRLDVIAEDEALGLKTRAQVIAATKRGNARIAEIDELLNASVTTDPMAAAINAPDPVSAWDALGLADQRVFIDRLCTVTILPSGRKGRGFDPTTVRIDHKHTLGGPPQPRRRRRQPAKTTASATA